MALIGRLTGIDTAMVEPEPAHAWLGVDRSLGDIRIVVLEVKDRPKQHWQVSSPGTGSRST